MEMDTIDYLRISEDLGNTLTRPVGYPLVISAAKLTSNYYLTLTIIQLIMFAWIMQVIYWIRGKIYVVVLLLISGAYLVYIPYVLSDLTFSFFVVASFYALHKKNLAWHIILIGIASVVRPTLAYFFIVEPFLVYFTFRDKKLAIYSLFLCFAATSISPLKNLIEHGQFIHTNILNFQANEYLLKSSHPLLYPFYSMFSNSVSMHWYETFRIFGLYKVDFSYLNGNIFVYILNYAFIAFYCGAHVMYLIRVVRTKDWVSLLWVGYFTGTGSLCHTIGGRHRLSFEFLIW